MEKQKKQALMLLGKVVPITPVSEAKRINLPGFERVPDYFIPTPRYPTNTTWKKGREILQPVTKEGLLMATGQVSDSRHREDPSVKSLHTVLGI